LSSKEKETTQREACAEPEKKYKDNHESTKEHEDTKENGKLEAKSRKSTKGTKKNLIMRGKDTKARRNMLTTD
jgi:hypothetical protein